MSWLINITANATPASSLDCKGNEEGIIFWTCVTSVSFVLAFPGAVAILVDMFQKGRKGTPFTPNDVYVSNIAVMDSLYLLFLLPHIYYMQHGLNLLYTSFIMFLYSFNLCGRPLFITCICLDCYLAVIHPITYRARKSLTPRVLMAVGVWTVTVAYGFYFATTNEALIGFSPIIFFALTLPVIGFCDISILWTLMRSNPGGKDMHPQKQKALQIIICNMIITVTSYFPAVMTSLVIKFVNLDENTITCDVMIPVITINIMCNTVSLFLSLNNMGKLDWLKCWKQK